MFSVRRADENPLLTPQYEHPWEAHGTFNWCPARIGNAMHVVYRALSEPDLLEPDHRQTSVIGCATTKDGIRFDDRRVLIGPSEEFDRFGCEDPRVTAIDGTHYIFYTGLSTYPYGPDGIKVAVATSRDLHSIDEKHLVTPFNAKAMALFPGKAGGKYAAILTANTDRPPSTIGIATFERLEDMYDASYWDDWYAHLADHHCQLPEGADTQTEVGAPPILTEHGWLLIYSRAEHYFDEEQRIFGIEAALLDRDDPRVVLAHTDGPFLVPETYYEKTGIVKRVVFPSGADVSGDALTIYYGAADMYGATATLSLKGLLDALVPARPQQRFARSSRNPLIAPREGSAFSWEAHGTFNPAIIGWGGTTHILYRAQGADDVSTMGYASSKDGVSIDERLDVPVYAPREPFERSDHPGNSGCEDPRIVRIDETLYMTYTAYDGVLPRVAATSIAANDFLARRFDRWAQPQLITPPGVDEKDSCIVPRQMEDGSFVVLHRVDDLICADRLPSLDFTREKITKCIEVMAPRRGMWDSRKIGIGAPPIETEHGWLLLYHGVSDDKIYRVGAALLDRRDPTILLSRTALPVFEPEEPYEKEGIIPNVVFPCGALAYDGVLHMYYGGADTVVGEASVPLDMILSWLV